MLRVGQFKAVYISLVAIGIGLGFSKGGVLARARQVRGVNKVLDILVEHKGRYGAGFAHVVLNAKIKVAGLQNIQLRVTEFRLIAIDYKARE